MKKLSKWKKEFLKRPEFHCVKIEKNNIKKFLPVFFKKIASVKDNITVEAKAIIEKIRKFLTPN